MNFIRSISWLLEALVLEAREVEQEVDGQPFPWIPCVFLSETNLIFHHTPPEISGKLNGPKFLQIHTGNRLRNLFFGFSDHQNRSNRFFLRVNTFFDLGVRFWAHQKKVVPISTPHYLDIIPGPFKIDVFLKKLVISTSISTSHYLISWFLEKIF